MCGRIRLSHPERIRLYMERQKSIKFDAGPSRENVPPTWRVPTLFRNSPGDIAADNMVWTMHGTITARDKSGEKSHKVVNLSNARADKLRSYYVYRNALQAHRMVMPVDGFYEWHQDRADKFPRLIEPTSESGLLFMAGLWQPEGDENHCLVITTDPCEQIAVFHHRMPVLLAEQDVDAWILSDKFDDVAHLVKPAPDSWVKVTAANPALNSTRGLKVPLAA